MDRRNFVKTAAGFSLAAHGGSFFGAGGQRLSLAGTRSGSGELASGSSGELESRYRLTSQRVVAGQSPAYTAEFLLADVRPEPVRRFTEYSGDLSGRYIGALATAARVYGESAPQLDGLVEQVTALQKPDGYFGSTFHYDKPTDEDLALLWGNGRLLVGLLEYDRWKASDRVMAASRRLGDWLVRIGPLMLSKEIRDEFGAQHFASSYICWMQQTEGMANLYARTRDERYRKLAEEIAGVIERRPGDHVHGYLTSLRGVMDLYAATGDARFLSQCEAAWADVASSKDALLTGGVPEGWSPNNHRTEGCAEADWVRLSLALWNATGDAKYLDAAERAVFNELAFNQFETGDFGHRLYTETGLPGNGAARAWWCCTLHGLRVFPDIHTNVLRGAKDGVTYNLPMDGRVETANLSAVAASTLAMDGRVKITVTAAGGETIALHIRRPRWATAIEVTGAQAKPLADGSLNVVKRWAPGDVISIRYAMNLRTEPDGDRVSYWCGPWLLGASAADNPAYFNELTVNNRLNRGAEKAMGEMRMRRPFSVPIAATEAGFAAAEYPDQPGSVVLRPIAEQTGLETTAWELRFLGMKKA